MATRNAEWVQEPKSIPNNIEAERAVLGALLIDADQFPVVNALLRPNNFFRERHAWLYEAICNLYNAGQPLEFVMVVDELRRMGKLEEMGGAAYVTDLISLTATAMYAEHYAEIVLRTSRLRKLIATAGDIAEAAYHDEANPDVVAQRISRWVNEFIRPRGERAQVDLRSPIQEEMERLEQLIEAHRTGTEYGLSFGWLIDKVIGGLQPGNVFVVAARPGIGKTSWTLAAAIRLALQGYAGIFFSLEMSRGEVVRKVISHFAQVDSAAIRSGELDDNQWAMIVQALDPVSLLPLAIVDKGCATVTQIRNHLLSLPPHFLPRFIVVDYVQLMSVDRGEGVGTNESRQVALEYIMQTLKSIAKEFDLVVFAVSQLNRGVELRADKRPMLADLRSSGAIEQAGDCVMFLYRESMARTKDSDTEEEYTDDGITELIVRKNRHGKTGTLKMHFNMPYNTYNDVVIERFVDDGQPVSFTLPPPPVNAQEELWNND